MDRKRRRMIEGRLYLFSLPSGADKTAISLAITKALETKKCGRVLGSGTSITNDCTVAIEIGAYDRDTANDAISRVCRRQKCQDFEIAWD
jgi:hypothetical protein